MTYNIKVSRAFQKDFAKLDGITQTKVLKLIEKIRSGPHLKAKKLTHVDVGLFRIRSGDYRIRFDTDGYDICLYRVRHRKDVYKN